MNIFQRIFRFKTRSVDTALADAQRVEAKSGAKIRANTGPTTEFLQLDTVGNNSVVVSFNSLIQSNRVKALQNSYDVTDLKKIARSKDDKSCHITIALPDGHRKYELTHDKAYKGDRKLIVGLINGQTIESNSDLFNKLTALRD